MVYASMSDMQQEKELPFSTSMVNNVKVRARARLYNHVNESSRVDRGMKSSAWMKVNRPDLISKAQSRMRESCPELLWGKSD